MIPPWPGPPATRRPSSRPPRSSAGWLRTPARPRARCGKMPGRSSRHGAGPGGPVRSGDGRGVQAASDATARQLGMADQVLEQCGHALAAAQTAVDTYSAKHAEAGQELRRLAGERRTGRAASGSSTCRGSRDSWSSGPPSTGRPRHRGRPGGDGADRRRPRCRVKGAGTMSADEVSGGSPPAGTASTAATERSRTGPTPTSVSSPSLKAPPRPGRRGRRSSDGARPTKRSCSTPRPRTWKRRCPQPLPGSTAYVTTAPYAPGCTRARLYPSPPTMRIGPLWQRRKRGRRS